MTVDEINLVAIAGAILMSAVINARDMTWEGTLERGVPFYDHLINHFDGYFENHERFNNLTSDERKTVECHYLCMIAQYRTL